MNVLHPLVAPGLAIEPINTVPKLLRSTSCVGEKVGNGRDED